MKLRAACVVVGFFWLVPTFAAQMSESTGVAQIPPLIQFSSVATDEGGSQMSGMVAIGFSLYNNARGGEPLWSETQNVQLDSSGHYSVYIGITKENGVPLSLFATGQAHWLGVRIAGQAEEPRVFLVSVPYAMEAGDAATVGGLPPSAFVLAGGGGASASALSSSPSLYEGVGSAANISGNIGGSGKQNYIPIWTNSSGELGNSILYQAGGSSVGIGTTAPTAKLDVNGDVISRGALQLPSKGPATAAGGYNSQPLDLQGSSFNSGTGKAIGPVFRWQTEPSGNNTTSPAGTLNLLYSNGSSLPGETGLNIASNGQITFVSGQLFPNTGTVTSVGSGAGLTGGPITDSGSLSIATGGVTNAMLAQSSLSVVAGKDLTGGGQVALGGTTTLNLDTTKVPLLNAANTFTGDQTVNGNLSVSGTVASKGATFVSASGTALQASTSKWTIELATPHFLLRGAANGGGVFTVDPSGNGVYQGSLLANSLLVGRSSGIVFQAINTSGANVSLATPSFLISAFSDSGDAFNVDYSGNVTVAGNLNVVGTLSKGSGSFKIDHPLDPANKYLYHSFVESPDMMDVYNGNVVTDKRGVATVVLPDYFEALNRDFRYQLTVIGQFAQAIVGKEISDGRFVIRTNRPEVKVSWQVTGIRQDAYANAHRIQVEEEKPPQEQGRFLHPELFGAGAEQAVGYNGRSPALAAEGIRVTKTQGSE